MKEVVKLTQDLVQIESVSGNEYDVVEEAQNWFDGYGIPNELDKFSAVRDDEEITFYNLEVGDVENAEFLIAAHLDTVDYDESDWEETDPLSGEIKDDKLYGRGSADTKSNAAAAMVAVKNAYEQYEDPNVALVLESDEETGFEGAKRFLSKYDEEDLAAEFTVMCEPEDLDIITQHKGLYHAVVNLHREIDQTHASKSVVHEDGEVYQPQEDAMQAAIPVLERLEEVRDYMKGLQPDEEMGPVTFATTLADIGQSNNTMAQNARIETDSRVPKNHSAQELAKKTEEMVEPLLEEGDSIELNAVDETVVVDRDNKFVRDFRQAAEEAGADPEYGSMDAYTELGLYHEALGIPGVIFGTSPNEVIHNPDEYVEVESIPIVQETFENMIEKMN